MFGIFYKIFYFNKNTEKQLARNACTVVQVPGSAKTLVSKLPDVLPDRITILRISLRSSKKHRLRLKNTSSQQVQTAKNTSGNSLQ